MIGPAVEGVVTGHITVWQDAAGNTLPGQQHLPKGERLRQLERDLESAKAVAAASREEVAAIRRIAESVPAIGRVLAQTTRVVELLKQDFVTQTGAQAAEIGALRDLLQGQIAAMQQQNDDLQRTSADFRSEIGRLGQRVQSLEAISTEMEPFREEDAAAHQQIVALRQGVEELVASQRELSQRIEFVRREILFEILHGTRASAPDGLAIVLPSIVDEEKVAHARANTLRLNLGCGHLPLEAYVNVDMRDLAGVDVIASVDTLPFELGTVDEIFSAHLIEHFPQEELRRKLLPYWRSLLVPGGRFRAIVPDAKTMIDQASRGDYEFEEFREVLFGAQDYVGDFHFNALTPGSFEGLLIEAGFTEVSLIASGRRNGKCFEFEIVACRPDDLESDAS